MSDSELSGAAGELTVILPAFNEAPAIGGVVRRLRERFPRAEVLVVDDCSTDETASEAARNGARVVRHLYNMGNGAAVKTGARNARGKVLVFMDADGQHAVEDIPRLLEGIDEGYELVVGARVPETQAGKHRHLGNGLLNKFASLLTGRKIPDLTSGFRAAKANVFRQFLYLLPNGFSYPTTSTMAFLRSGFAVKFVPIHAGIRVGKSKIRFVKDGVRFMVIAMKVTTLFSPMRFFFPLSVLFFVFGLARYVYHYLGTHTFSEMAGILFVTSVMIFLVGLVSEQITAVHYGNSLIQARERQFDDVD